MNMNVQKLQMMRDEKIPKILIKLGIPTMIGMIVSALYIVVDAYFVGGLGTSQMGAVSIVFPIVQVIVGLGMTFGSGAASYISRLLGEGNDEKANRTASTALFSSLFVGVVSIIISLCFLDKILITLGATATILPYAREYALIYVSGSILNIMNVTMNNMITAEGRTQLTMISMLIGGILNVILDPIFIYPLGFGIRGAAIATVISQMATTYLYLWFILGKKGYLRFSIRLFTFDGTILGEIFKVGIPILVFQILASAAMGLSNTAASVYGDSAVAAIGVVTRIMTLGTYVVFGYMKGFQPIAGYNYGAKRYDRLSEATKVSLKWSTIFCTIVALFMVIFPTSIISLFSENDVELIDIGTKALRANGIIFPFYGFQMVYMALFLAMGKGKEGGLLSIGRQGLFFIPVILIFPRLFHLEGVIWTQPVADLLTVVLTAVFALQLHKKLKLIKQGGHTNETN
ncbi:MATE family efflux transporter [Inediibacterium massiliense]|uniref:MATE family efflux transporter n=1 Tax=Inediibacterium massiliense TaxID=1658111 RepID=UPI0006B55B62|nr:MATE family efflux transporter [Inediibacterium massiliense]